MQVAAQNLQSIKTFLTLELSQYCQSGSACFLQASRLLPAETSAYSEMPCVWMTTGCLDDDGGVWAAAAG